MSDVRHISWDIFSNDYINPSVPAVYVFPGSPKVSLYVSDAAQRIGVKIEIPPDLSLPEIPFRELKLETRIDGEYCFADFSTENSVLYEHFFSMINFISDLVQIKNVQPAVAIQLAVDQFKVLISDRTLLNEEKIVGIWGELWVLEKLINKRGPESVLSWKGPEKSIHDFRIEDLEIEVKTTRNEERIHIISRLTQLDHSPDFSLYLCSIQIIENTGEGLTLPAYVNKIKNLLESDQKLANYFEKQLLKENYKSEDGKYYKNAYCLRSNPEMVIVNEYLPHLTREMIFNSYGEKLGQRISNVKYQLDVTGLGIEYTHKQFKKYW